MAWNTPRTWADDEIVTATYLNQQIRDNMNALSAHTHGGSAGDGSATLASGISFTGLATTTFADQSGDPSVTGRLQRNGNNLVYYNGSAVITLSADAAAGTASLRSLGTTSVKAAAGNHTHTPNTPSTSALTASNVLETESTRAYRYKNYSAGETLDGTSKTVTPTLANNLVIVVCFVSTANATELGDIDIKETVSASEANVQTGITARLYEKDSDDITQRWAYGADYIERADRTVATYTYHLEANDDVSISGAWLMATVVEA